MNEEPTVAEAESPSTSAGVGWATAGQVGAQIINFVSQIALALPGLLLPTDFGMAAFAWATMAVLDALVDFGIGLAVVQREKLTQGLIDTAFTLNMLLSLMATGCMIGIGFVVDNLTFEDFDSHGTAVLLWQFSAASLFTGVMTIWRALLWRGMRLDAIAKVEVGGAAIRGACGIALAAAGMGVQSLVVAYYLSGLFTVIAFGTMSRHRMHFRLYGEERRALLRFGVSVTGFNLLNNLLRNADTFILGPLVGQEKLGIFSLVKRLMFQIVNMAGAVVSSVLVPQLSRLQGSVLRSRALYLRAGQYLTVSMLPFLVIVSPAARFLSDLGVLSEKWEPVGSISAAALPAAIVMLLLQTPVPLLVASGRSGALLKWGMVRGGAMVLAFSTAGWLGLHGATLALAVVLVLAMPALLSVSAELLRVSRWGLVHDLLQLLPATLASLASLWLARWMLTHFGMAVWATELCGGAAAVLVYLLVLILGQPRAWRTTSRFLRRFFERRAVPQPA